MNWVQAQLDDTSLFPAEPDAPFPPTFLAVIKGITRRLFRVYAHMYKCVSLDPCPRAVLSSSCSHHFAQLCALSIEAHINTSYRHFLLFVTEASASALSPPWRRGTDADIMPQFNLVDRKELAPLSELNEGILSGAEQ